jgi:hypothetical protein
MPRSLSLASHTASSLSVLGRPGRCSGVAGVDQPHHQAAGFQQVHERPPVVGGGLDHDALDPLAGQLLGQLDDGVGGGRHLPYLGGALARLGRVRHPRAHHPRRLGHVDRGDLRHDLLGCFDLGDVAVLGHQPASCHRWGRFGAAREPGGEPEL